MRILTPTEVTFKQFLEANHYPHLYVSQATETYGSCTKDYFKRPDFLVSLPSLGLIAVDVKDRRPHSKGDFILDCEREADRFLNFQRLFMLPGWYCFMSSSQTEHRQVWSFISLDEVLMSPIRFSHNQKKPFYSVSPRKTISIDPQRDSLMPLLEQKIKQAPLPFLHARMN